MRNKLKQAKVQTKLKTKTPQQDQGKYVTEYEGIITLIVWIVGAIVGMIVGCKYFQ